MLGLLSLYTALLIFECLVLRWTLIACFRPQGWTWRVTVWNIGVALRFLRDLAYPHTFLVINAWGFVSSRWFLVSWRHWTFSLSDGYWHWNLWKGFDGQFFSFWGLNLDFFLGSISLTITYHWVVNVTQFLRLCCYEITTKVLKSVVLSSCKVVSKLAISFWVQAIFLVQLMKQVMEVSSIQIHL